MIKLYILFYFKRFPLSLPNLIPITRKHTHSCRMLRGGKMSINLLTESDDIGAFFTLANVIKQMPILSHKT